MGYIDPPTLAELFLTYSRSTLILVKGNASLPNNLHKNAKNTLLEGTMPLAYTHESH